MQPQDIFRAGAEAMQRVLAEALRDHLNPRAAAIANSVEVPVYASEQAVPAGWKLVPVDLTYEPAMREAAWKHIDNKLFHGLEAQLKALWSAMLSAAPTPPDAGLIDGGAVFYKRGGYAVSKAGNPFPPTADAYVFIPLTDDQIDVIAAMTQTPPDAGSGSDGAGPHRAILEADNSPLSIPLQSKGVRSFKRATQPGDGGQS